MAASDEIKSVKKSRPAVPFFELLEPRQMLTASADATISPSIKLLAAASSSTSVSSYSPAQIKSAYGFSSINFNGVTGDGSGQTIAIVDAYSDPNIASDLAVFDAKFGLSAPASFKQVSASGSTSSLPAVDGGWAQEISLDVEWAHAIAPKASIILVDAASSSLHNLMAAVNYARNAAGVSVVSMSWGSSEFSGQSAYDKYFTTPAGHTGVTFVAASGDGGAADGAEWPAASPNVLSVGGTTLSISSSGTATSETAWSDSSGGSSTVVSAPSYQSGVSTNGMRSVPDVSYNADPNTGYAVYDSLSYQGSVGWSEVGGTSAGAPQWAALIAIADQGRVASGSGTLDGATGTLPAIYKLYSSATTYAANFTDITVGGSGFSGGGFGGGFGGGPGGGFGRWGRWSPPAGTTATVGYDQITGLGTPKAAALVQTLSTVKTSTAKTSTATKTATASAKKKTAKAAVVVASSAGSYVTDLVTTAPVTSAVVQPARVSAPDAVGSTSPFSSTKSLIADRSPTPAAPRTLLALSGYLTAAAGDQSSSLVQAAVDHFAGSAASLAARVAAGVKEKATDLVISAASAPAEVLSIPVLNYERTFRDALSDFADECAAVPAAPLTGPPSMRALSATAAFVAADAVLLGYFYAKQKSRKRAAAGIFNDKAIIDDNGEPE